MKHPFASPPRDDDGLRSDGHTFAQRGTDRRANWWAGFGRLKPSIDPKKFKNICAPFANSSIFRLVQHYYQSIQDSSISGFNWFVRHVLKADDFKLSDIPDDFDLAKELKRLDNLQEDESPFAHAANWKEATIEIPLPAEGVKHRSENHAPTLKIEGVLYRDMVEVIKSAFQAPESINFHYTPAKAYYMPAGAKEPERVYSEIYESDEFWEEHKAIMKALPADQRNMPVTVAALMLYSDATHLANFGSAFLWPYYLFFGNQSKYERAKPSNYAAHHLAYIPKVCLLRL